MVSVCSHVGHDSHCVDRADVDDVALVARDHRRQHSASDAHRADQVGADDVGPVIGRTLVEPRAPADVVSGIVDQHLDRPECIRDLIEQAVDRGMVGNVEPDRMRPGAEFGREPVE
jgi:hypothetical protein